METGTKYTCVQRLKRGGFRLDGIRLVWLKETTAIPVELRWGMPLA